jgi:hypothetical protein
LAGHLDQAGAAGFIDRQPAGLTADLELAASLAAGGEPLAWPCGLRLVMLDATIPGSCPLPGIIAPPGAGNDGSPRVSQRSVQPLNPSQPGPIMSTLIHAPLVPEDRELMPEVRAALIDAHAIVIAVGYRDVIVDPHGSRARDTEARVRGWLLIARQVAAPELLTVVVDGVEESNSNPATRLAWTRRHAREALRLPLDWPSAGIIETSSRAVVEETEAEQAGKAPPGQQAHAWDAYGITELLGRTLGPYELDPARWFTESALRRARAVFAWAEHELSDRLAVRPRDGRVEPDQLLLPHYARQRQAWLLALGLGGWLRRAIPEIDTALSDLEVP